MTRPLRINVEGGWYHITARGDNRERIYDDDGDRRDFLERGRGDRSGSSLNN